MADQIEWRCEDDDIAPDSKLAGDVMVSILTYLPIKSLLKFKSVSKPWCALISSPRFTKLHLHRQSLVAPNNCLMLLSWEDYIDLGKRGWKHGLLDLSRNYNTPADNDVLNLENPQSCFSIFDSCNGLVCLVSRTISWTRFMLWNPATKRHRTLDFDVPESERDNLICGSLGIYYVDATNDFKILVWNSSFLRSPVVYLYVYSLSSGSLEKLPVDNHKTDIHFFERPTFMGKCMHWLVHKCPNAVVRGCSFTDCASASEIVAFDVMDGAMSWFNLPVSCVHHSKTVEGPLVIRGCLSIVSSDHGGVNPDGFEVWVMEEYGVEGSWVKRFFIQEEQFTRVVSPFRSWSNGEIVYINNKDVSKVVIFLDLFSGKKRYVEFSSYCVSRVFNYVESLASVGTSYGGGLDSCGEKGDCYGLPLLS